jgi:DNA-binding HxlR family transcriptional regulator
MGDAARSESAATVRLVEDVLGCKWTLQVLAALVAGARRPGRLRRAVAGISTKVMNERLQKLVGHGVLERRALSLMPPHVEYELTPKGRELAAVVDEVQRFCARWDTPASDGRRVAAGRAGREAARTDPSARAPRAILRTSPGAPRPPDRAAARRTSRRA